MVSYLSFQRADEEGFQRLAGLVAVADILERLGCVLSGHVQKNLLTTAVWSLSVLSDHIIAEGQKRDLGERGGGGNPATQQRSQLTDARR